MITKQQQQQLTKKKAEWGVWNWISLSGDSQAYKISKRDFE